jgi:hypothetical protein
MQDLLCVVGYALAKGSATLISAFVITWFVRKLGIEDWFYEIKYERKIVSRGETDVQGVQLKSGP